LTSSREKEITTLIERCKEDAERKDETLERRGIEIMGKKEVLNVYRLPIKSLRYNIRNGRFAAELRAVEAKKGRKLDTNDPDDAAIVKKILREQSKEETQFLKKDLKQKGQIDPGLITHDGYVINGNRRMAIFELLYEEEPDPKFEFLDVQVLPISVTPKDLWRIEAGLQLSRDKRLDYSPVNQLLKIEEGIRAGLKPEEIAKSFYGKVTGKNIVDDLERLKLMKEYLNYIGKPDDLKLADRLDNHFINLQKQIQKLQRKGVTKSDINKAIVLGYETILGGVRHLDVRHLAEVILSDRARDGIEKALDEPDELDAEESPVDEALEAGELDGAESEEEAEVESLSSDSLELSRRRGKAKRIVEEYKNALDVVDFEKSREEPRKLIRKAIDAIESIDKESDHILRAEVKRDLKELAKRVMEFLELIEKGSQKG